MALGRHMLWATASILAAVAPGHAIAAEARHYELRAQPLGVTIRDIALASGVNIVAPTALVEGRTAPPLVGPLTVEEALAGALEGSGLAAEPSPNGFVVVAKAARPEDGMASDADDGTIVVTGTRIRGAPIASPVIVAGQADFRNAGQASLSEVTKSIPQNFGGGQNPGIGTNVPATNGVDLGGGASINLRGLGSDATLTLLDGHRLSYSASRQSVDVSAIPLLAVERIEIVPDGASALYGSDAVAGVANIILRRGVEGLETDARLGTSTDGGNFSQQYGAIAGARWGRGGLAAAYEYGRNSPIEAKDRSYAQARSPGLTLYPALEHHSATFAAGQALTDRLSLDLDALYNHRRSSSFFPLSAAGNPQVSGGRSFAATEGYAVIPTLRFEAASDWRFALTGSYGRDRVDYGVDLFNAGVRTSAGSGYYYNSARTAELGGDGSLFALAGGRAKLAVGGGYRRIDFASFRGAGNFQNIERDQDSYFGYAELNLPFVSPAQGLAFAHRLNASLAARYENYPGIGDVLTPKIGLIYAPVDDVALKGSWGRSFRAPTLLQQYDPASVGLSRASARGGTGFPSGSTVLTTSGGNPDLKPERATSWSATLDLHPRALEGARLELSYFHTRYRDRVVTPVGVLAVALSNPIYRDQVTLAPSDAAKAAVLASAATFINAAGAPYDPARVVAIIDNRNVNAGRQTLQGIDLLASYRTALGGGRGDLTATLNASYLESERRLSPSQPVIELAGTLFNPPRWRARGGLSWDATPVTLSAFLNHTGGVDDTRFTPAPDIDGMTTLDLTLRLASEAESGLARGLELTASLLNAFNAKPTPIRTSIFTDTPYDSTNYSPIGRFIALGVRKSW